jgi:hypothetical protein
MVRTRGPQVTSERTEDEAATKHDDCDTRARFQGLRKALISVPRTEVVVRLKAGGLVVPATQALAAT